MPVKNSAYEVAAKIKAPKDGCKILANTVDHIVHRMIIHKHMKPTEQVNLWVKGHSMHNPVTEDCCPDFSCCIPSIETPLETKLQYQEALENDDEPAMRRLLFSFVTELLNALEIKPNYRA